jgi:hypothetical protein
VLKDLIGRCLGRGVGSGSPGEAPERGIACIDVRPPGVSASESPSPAGCSLTYAYSAQAVNGVPGTRVPGNFRIPAEPAGPEHTFAGPLGGEGPHDHDHEEVAS